MVGFSSLQDSNESMGYSTCLLLQIMAVFTAALPIVSAGGFLYSMITGSPLQLGLLKVYGVIIRVPGVVQTQGPCHFVVASLTSLWLSYLHLSYQHSLTTGVPVY